LVESGCITDTLIQSALRNDWSKIEPLLMSDKKHDSTSAQSTWVLLEGWGSVHRPMGLWTTSVSAKVAQDMWHRWQQGR